MSGPGPLRDGAGLSASRRFAITATSALATLGLLIVIVGLVGLWLYRGPGPAAHGAGQTTVILRPGASLPEIASTLRREGAISSATVFQVAAQLTGAARHLKAGEYAFDPHTSMAAVLGKLRHHEVVHHMVTIPEGLTSGEAVDTLMGTDILTGSAPIPAEGSILPETYEVQRGEDRAAVLQQMMNARDQLLAELWSQRRTDLPITTPEQAVVLASIVEKETALPAERPRVAAVFLNRLEKGMKLDSDPTVIYGLTQGRPLGRGIRESELQDPTPYNTYSITGLPPTPICNPGRASLAAVLDAPHTTELYFVANGTGGHVFSSTLEEHEKNVARWRQIEHAQKAAPTLAMPSATPSLGAG